ncbi:MAG: hypothetical protein O9972_58275 [Burkholderiales bacterium]|nr:hypothetical protein [Burkholderiales bacterium]
MPDGQLVRFGTTAGAIPRQRAVPVDRAPRYTFASTPRAVDGTPPPRAGTRLVSARR